MSGCYRCGLPEGSEARLCETCYRQRFYRGQLVADAPCEQPAGGIELSPRAQTIVLGGGALMYLGIIGFAMLSLAHQPGVTAASAPYEFYSSGEGTAIVGRTEAVLRVPAPQRGPAPHAGGDGSGAHG